MCLHNANGVVYSRRVNMSNWDWEASMVGLLGFIVFGILLFGSIQAAGSGL